MAKKKNSETGGQAAPAVKLTHEEEESLNSTSLDSAGLDPLEQTFIGSVADLAGTAELKDTRFGPPMWSEDWQDFVLKQFADNETDEEGNPFIHGLRRVARKVLGPIVSSGPTSYTDVQPAAPIGDPNGWMMNPVSVCYVVRILWSRPEDIPENGTPFTVEFSDLADVMRGNTDPEFLKFPSAMASTRAEGRALRKALQLKKVAAEEKTRVPLDEPPASGDIRESDIIFIDALCRRCDIDVMKFVNAGKAKYESIDKVPYGTAQAMTQHLSGLQNDMSKIKPNLKGYRADWRPETNF